MTSQTAIRSAYLHIPFCQSKCAYCDFVSLAGQSPAQRAAYLAALQKEIRQSYAYYQKNKPGLLGTLHTVYFGGGTPSLLPADQIATIMDVLRSTFGLAPDCECTMEVNPGTVQADQLAGYLAAGINRLSIGLQASQDHLLQLLGRQHDLAAYHKTLQLARQAGFNNLSVDLIFGLPGQSQADLIDTLAALQLDQLSHVSYYSLILEEGTPLQQAYQEKLFAMPPDEEERAHYHLLRQQLAQAGLDPYEISSSARPARQCRHNLVYWQALPYYGFGLAAHSYVASRRSSNTSELGRYLADYSKDAAGLEQPPGQLLELIDEKEAMREMLLLGLRLTDGVSDKTFRARFGLSLFEVFASEIDQLCRQQLLACSKNSIWLSKKGLDLANQAFMLFVG